MAAAELKPYIELIRSYLEGRLSAERLVLAYQDRFKNDPTRWPEAQYQLLDRLFADLDVYAHDPSRAGPDTITESQLRSRCALAVKKLESF